MSQDVDKELQELAKTDWDKFKVLIGLDPTLYEVCKKRKKGNSYNQIAVSLKLHRSKVRRVCAVCP